MLAAFLVFTAFAPAAWAQGPEIQQRPTDIRTLQAEVRRLAAVVQDPYAGEREFSEARAALLRSMEAINRLAAAEVKDDQDAVGPAGELRVQAADLVASIDRRLPPAAETTSGSAIERTLIVVPDFEQGTLAAEQADALKEAYGALINQMARTSDDRAGRERLVPALVLAQQQLAWAAGWPFSPEEVDLLRSVGRERDRGSTQKAFVEVYNRRVSRGVENINRRLAEESDANGRSRAGVYVLYRAASDDQQWAVEKQLLELLSAEMSLAVADPEAIRGFSTRRARSFDEFEAWKLRR